MVEPGDVVTALLPGAVETKRRPAVVISSGAYHSERPDVLLAIITSRTADAGTQFDHVLLDWEEAGLKLPSAMRSFIFTKTAGDVRRIGRLSERDWAAVKECLERALATG